MKQLLVVLALLLAAPAFAQELAASEEASRRSLESERRFVLELRGGRFRPEIDSRFPATAQPYNDIFGKKAMWLFEGELDYELYQGIGTLSAGFAAGYGAVYGHGIVALTGEQAPDLTVLKILPLRLLAVYRFDWLARELGIPLVPFGKLGLAHTLWWVTEGTGAIAKFGSDKALGGKWGYEAALGLAFELNFIDRAVGREFDADFGVNHVFAFGELTRLTANNFGSAKGLDLSDTSWQFGLAFEF